MNDYDADKILRVHAITDSMTKRIHTLCGQMQIAAMEASQEFSPEELTQIIMVALRLEARVLRTLLIDYGVHTEESMQAFEAAVDKQKVKLSFVNGMENLK